MPPMKSGSSLISPCGTSPMINGVSCVQSRGSRSSARPPAKFSDIASMILCKPCDKQHSHPRHILPQTIWHESSRNTPVLQSPWRPLESYGNDETTKSTYFDRQWRLVQHQICAIRSR